LTDPDSLQSAIRATVDAFGRLDILHNNAGGSTAKDGTAVDAPLDEFWRAIKLDLYGTFLGCRLAIPELIKGGGGSVINMSSNVALMGSPAAIVILQQKAGSPPSRVRLLSPMPVTAATQSIFRGVGRPDDFRYCLGLGADRGRRRDRHL
jgi:NAD(P)-dependent dehydrogenase (short-subunit alcohol dehydrogenase family)